MKESYLHEVNNDAPSITVLTTEDLAKHTRAPSVLTSFEVRHLKQDWRLSSAVSAVDGIGSAHAILSI
jgi:hypothetical protein